MTDAPVTAPPALVSPRTADEPMAFTLGELWRGGLYAWLFFLMALCLWILAPMAVAPGAYMSFDLGGLFILTFYILLFGGPISGFAFVLATPLAGALGTRLRRVRSRWIHLLTFAGYGALIGGTVGILYALVLGPSGENAFASILYFVAMSAGLTAVAAALGWLVTVQQAFRKDAKLAAEAAGAKDPEA